MKRFQNPDLTQLITLLSRCRKWPCVQWHLRLDLNAELDDVPTFTCVCHEHKERMSRILGP